MINGSTLYQSVIPKTHERFCNKVCIVDHYHHLCPNAPSHITMCVSEITWKPWFEWQKMGWALTCIERMQERDIAFYTRLSEKDNVVRSCIVENSRAQRMGLTKKGGLL